MIFKQQTSQKYLRNPLLFRQLFIIGATSINSLNCQLIRLTESKNTVNLQIDKKVQYKGDKLQLQYFKGKSDLMGSQQPKPISRVTKPQIDIGLLKARIHLELVRQRKHAQIIKVQKELVAKMKSKSRNKTEETLIAERVVLTLKYAQACDLLIGYASNLRLQAQFIADNMNNPVKMEPFLMMIYSLIFAADRMGLFSLSEFKALMRALNDPMAIQKYVNPEISNALIPSPLPEELNVYMLEFSERNNISLQEINMIGHRFTKEWKNIPSVAPTIPSNFTDLSNQPGNNGFGPGGNNGFNPGGNGNQGGYNNQGGFNNQGGYNNQGYNNQGGFNNQGLNNNHGGNFNPYQNMDPRQFFNNNGGNNANIGGNNQGGYNPQNSLPNNNPYPGQNNPYLPPSNPINQFVGANNNNNVGPNNQPASNPSLANKTPANLGPDIFIPPVITPTKAPQTVRQSITSLNDIDYYPQIDANPALFNKGTFNDPDFQKICERLKKGL